MLALVGVSGAENDVVRAKRILRSEALRRRAELADADRTAFATAVAANVLALPEVASARCVAAYVGVGTELSTRPLLDGLADRVVLLPVLLADDALAWGRWDGTLVPGPRGLLEPPVAGAGLSNAGVVVVPGVAFDAAGGRLGRGGGSYDRALATVRVPVVGLALDDEVVNAVPMAAHDRRVDVVVTPTRVLRARS